MFKASLAAAAILVTTPVLADTALSSGADWTGGYVGLQYDIVDAEAVIGGALDGDAFGLFVGYRHDFGPVVLGIELDYMVGSLTAAPGTSFDMDSLVRLGIEAGYDLGPALVYGTVGHAQMELSFGPTQLDFGGLFYGIGIDYAVSERVTLGAELLRHDFNDINGIPGNDLDATTFGINVAYRF